MGSQQNNAGPVFRLYVKDADVTVRFSEEESKDVKCRVRDILTGHMGNASRGKDCCAGTQNRRDERNACMVIAECQGNSGFSLDLESRITAGSAIPYSNRYGGSV